MRAPAAGVVHLWLGPADSDVLDSVLRRYLSATATVSRGEHGKPTLATGELEFNLSYAGGLSAVAVNTDYAVGIDIERERAWRDPARFARRFLAREEADALRALPPGRRCAALTSLWTAKEAYVKALGTGLTETPPRTFVIDGTSVTTTHDGAPAWAWSLAKLALPEGYCGTLALRGPLGELRVFARG
jgi:4'-phosphopantetheinyl transferase